MVEYCRIMQVEPWYSVVELCLPMFECCKAKYFTLLPSTMALPCMGLLGSSWLYSALYNGYTWLCYTLPLLHLNSTFTLLWTLLHSTMALPSITLYHGFIWLYCILWWLYLSQLHSTITLLTSNGLHALQSISWLYHGSGVLGVSCCGECTLGHTNLLWKGLMRL